MGQWLAFSADLETALSELPGGERMMSFDGRYSYGELRLTRLNFIMRVFRGVARGYVISTHSTQTILLDSSAYLY